LKESLFTRTVTGGGRGGREGEEEETREVVEEEAACGYG